VSEGSVFTPVLQRFRLTSVLQDDMEAPYFPAQSAVRSAPVKLAPAMRRNAG